LLSTALQLNVATFVVGRAIQGHGGLSDAHCWKSFVSTRHDQDWGDGGMTEVVQRQFQLNRREEFMKAFVQDAIARVVKPLTDNSEAEETEPERGRRQKQ